MLLHTYLYYINTANNMPYYNRSNKYTKKNYGGGNTQRASEKYKSEGLKVTVSPGKTGLANKEPAQNINIYNVDPDSAKLIASELIRLRDENGTATANAWVDKLDPTLVHIKVYTKDIDKWLDGGDLNKVQSILLKAKTDENPQEYQEKVMRLEDKIAIGLQSGNRELAYDLNKLAQDSMISLWKKYLSTIHDPVTMEQIKLYSRVYRANNVYGAILSIKNANLIRAVDPTATFVTTAGEWERRFGRGVKRGAKPLPYYTWSPSNKASDKDIEQAKQDTNWEDTKTSDLSAQVLRALEIKASDGKNGFIVKRIGYDVKDTYLLNGKRDNTDTWTDQIGLLNNLNGELNAHAQQHYNDNMMKHSEETKNIEGYDEMSLRTKKVVEYMEENAANLGISVSKSTDLNNKLADMVYEYCMNKVVEKANVLNSANANIFAENATKIALTLTKLAWPAMKRFNRTYEYDEKEVLSLMNIVFNLVKIMEEHSVISEGIVDWLKNKAAFLKIFLKTLKQIGCKVVKNKTESENMDQNEEQNTEIQNEAKMVKENFFNMLNRMNEVPWMSSKCE